MRADWCKPLPAAHGAAQITYDLFYDTVELGGIAVDPTGKFLYLENAGGNDVFIVFGESISTQKFTVAPAGEKSTREPEPSE